MSNTIEAFPLQWPLGFERSKVKEYSNFKCTLAQARDGVLYELEKLGATNYRISSNVPVKRDGQMYGSMKAIDGDNGIAVYFTWKGKQRVLACDAYYSLWENLRAIEKSLDAMRGLGRWKVSNILDAAFTGFKTLAESNDLGFEVTKENYKALVKKYHPDNPDTGDIEMFLKIQEAYKQ